MSISLYRPLSMAHPADFIKNHLKNQWLKWWRRGESNSRPNYWRIPESVPTIIFPSFHSVIQALQRQVGMTYTANSEPSLAFCLTSPLPQLRGVSNKWRIRDYPRSSLHRATIMGQSRPKLQVHSHYRHLCF